MMLMAEIRLDGTHKRLHGDASHLFNIGELTNDQRTELIRRFENIYGPGSLKVSPSVIPTPIPDINQPPKTDGLSNGDFLQYQFQLEKEVLTLAANVRQCYRQSSEITNENDIPRTFHQMKKKNAMPLVQSFSIAIH